MWRDSESERDFLNFGEVADQIVELVRNPDLLPISVGVFGGWGSGKSTILRLAEGRLAAAGTDAPTVVKFDAWLYQGFDDARAALMEVVARTILAQAEAKKTLVDKAKDFAARVNYFRALGTIADFAAGMAFGIPAGLLTRAGGALSSIFAGKVTAQEVADATSETRDAAKRLHGLYDLVRPVEKRTPPKEIEAFRQEFGDLLEGLGTTLVLFIDNLDRCLPDAAIGTLEAVRLFLFMPRTAFVIAADEGMIRHSVAKHFGDPEAPHVRDYLDKVIQVPLRVPQVSAEELRAYMYSLFVTLVAPQFLETVQKRLMQALRESWKGHSFGPNEVVALAGNPAGLLDNLAIADRLAPILASAPNVQGNPRIVKRLLSAVLLRRLIAKGRNMNVDLATLAKLAVFERCTDEQATLRLYRLVMEDKEVARYLVPLDHVEGTPPELPLEWKRHEKFISAWRGMEPVFEGIDLKPAVFLSRDVLAPSLPRPDQSAAASEAITGLLKVTSVNSPVGKKLVDKLSLPEQTLVMSRIIDSMRQADWSGKVPGIHGAVILARISPELTAMLKAFVATLPTEGVDRGISYLLKSAEGLGKP
ncbi:MAG: P-loop NTPase fold protein [Candidatus Binatales bacterium]